ncbi:type VII secretion target [Mycobacterium riyadhense]|uniref:ESX-1 secretion-associated protein n=1 Tax=Mycobacterium riyadhense TaxID=486698 RepID=A0A653EPY8_9MYCO|nr:type VII secretion target [Mycobacterium riyadhense]VTO99583.1 hypothetical protein BIN_B_03055 [Mycobacterium riyadhense]
MSLRFETGDVAAFAGKHDAVAAQILAAATPDPAIAAAMSSAFGPAGAKLTDAVAAFDAALFAAGTDLSKDFHDFANTTRSVVKNLLRTDAASGNRVGASTTTQI